DLQAFSDSYSKPLDHVAMRENELVSQMQVQLEPTLAELVRSLSQKEQNEEMARMLRLLAFIAVLLIPLGMAAPVQAHSGMDMATMAHCPEKAGHHHSKGAGAECNMACAFGLPALHP